MDAAWSALLRALMALLRVLMVLRVRYAPTRFPTDILETIAWGL